MKNIIKNWLAYSLLIGMAVVWLFIFTLILIYGEFGVYEPNPAILILEIVTCILVLTLGIERVYNLIKTNRNTSKREARE